MARALLVLGSGGHTTQMLALAKQLDGLELEYLVGYDDELSMQKLPKSAKVYRVHRGRSPKDDPFTTLWKMLRLGAESMALYYKSDFDAVITCGPAIAIPICMMMKLYGKKIIFIEDWTRVYKKSLTGKTVGRFASIVFIQWQEMREHYPDAVYAGRLPV